MKIPGFINTHRWFLLISFFYFLFRLLFLLRLPIFNDESIYLDWGWRELHGAGLFYSLYDAKQPFFMWIFGIFEMVFSDPLFAGRFASVLAGFCTFIGLYKLAQILWDKSTAYVVSALYMMIPIFSFFDRQALMESAVTAIGVWICYRMILLLKNVTQKNAIILGCIVGLGILIKSTVFLFALTTFVILLYQLCKKESKQTTAKTLTIIVITIVAIDLLLFMQPLFWLTLHTNDRFSLSLRELLDFPFLHWIQNLSADGIISFIYLTPLIFITSICGIVLSLRTKHKSAIVLVWFAVNLSLQILVTRNISQRYLVSFLPSILLFAASFVIVVFKQKLGKYIALVVIIGIPFIMTTEQLIAPAAYILALAKFEPYAQPEYITGNTSGYGLSQVRNFLEEQAHKQSIFVGIAENSGNPESALQVYYENNPAISVIYFDKQLLGNSVDQFNCIAVQKPLYFISRDQQQGGLNNFFVKLKTIAKPYGAGSIGIYTINSHCHGKTGHLELTTQN